MSMYTWPKDSDPGPKQPYERFEPSIDCVTNAQRHLAFLQEVDTDAKWLAQPHVIANALRRYEICWLELLKKHNTEDLLPPLDIHWVWHVHMLCPRQYAGDIVKIVGKLVDHRFHVLRNERQALEAKTKRVWTDTFPDEKFEVTYNKIPSTYTYTATKVSYDIQAASLRQLQFYYNVSLPHFGLVPFLEEAKARYQKFIYLKSLNKEAFLVPMYDIDLLWHTHQLSPVSYDQDSRAWLGCVLNHDDTATDLSPGSHLNDSFAQTQKLWKESFNEEYAIQGVGYRGPQPRGKLHEMGKEDIDKYKSKVATVRLDSVIYSHHKKTGKISGSVEYTPQVGDKYNSRRAVLSEMKTEPFAWGEDINDSRLKDPGGLLTFDFEPDATCYFDVRLKSSKGILAPLLKGEKVFKEIVTGTPELRDMVDNNFGETTIKHSNDKNNVVHLALSVIKTKPVSNYLKFDIQGKNKFYSSPMPDNVEEKWGPIYLPKAPEVSSNVWQVADHRLRNKDLLLDVRVAHSLKLNMSIVQVLYQKKLIAISQTIGPDQLPNSSQVSSSGHRCMTLDVKKGERAMLIKNHEGDWAIMKGKWEDKIYMGRHFGCLEVKSKILTRTRNTTFKVLEFSKAARSPKLNLKESFKFMESAMSLRYGSLTVDCHQPELAENVAALFSALVLYTLCEPRRGDKPGADRDQIAKLRKSKNGLDPSKYELMRAAGYMTDTPSNSYWWWMWHSDERRRPLDHYQWWDWSDDDDDIHKEQEDPDTKHDSDGPDAVEASGERYFDIFCPWDPDNNADQSDLISDFANDISGGTTAACGSCATSSGMDHFNDAIGMSYGNDSGFSSCASSGGGGGFSSCGSSCGSSGGGGGSSCGSSCGGGGGGSD